MYRSFLLFLSVFTYSFVFAQFVPPPPPTQSAGSAQVKPPGHIWTFGFNAGMVGYSPDRNIHLEGSEHFQRTFNFGMGTLSDVEGNSSFAIIANTTLGIHAGISFVHKTKKTHITTIEGELQMNKATYSYDPPFLFMVQGDTFGRWVMTDKYFKGGISIQHSWEWDDYSALGGPRHIFVGAGIGQSFYHRNFNVKLEQGRFEDWSNAGTGMTALTTQVNPQSMMLSFEGGLRHYNVDYDRHLDIGLAVFIPMKPTYTDQYSFYRNGTLVGRQDVTYHGSMAVLNVRYTFGKTTEARERDTTRHKPEIYVYNDTTRSVDVQASYTSTSKRIRIKVWDRNEIDGDIISLYMNDVMLKKNLKLKKRKKTIRVKLKPGVNTLVMYAENLGEIPPNTAAIQIRSKGKKKNVTLVSDNGKSGAIDIIYNPR